jgi:hypothetical protein
MPSVTIQKPLLAGNVYTAKIIQAAEKTSKRSGNPMLELTVKVGEPGNTVEIRDYLVFTPNMMGNLTRFAEAIGLPVPQNEGETLSIEEKDCLGKRARVELGDSERENPKTGKPYLEITAWLPLPAGDTESRPF